jgi:hypothetical protein
MCRCWTSTHSSALYPQTAETARIVPGFGVGEADSVSGPLLALKRFQEAADTGSMNKRNPVLSAVVLLWGTAALIYGVTAGSATHGSGAYQTGRVAALVFLFAMVVAGARGLRNELRKRAGEAESVDAEVSTWRGTRSVE